MTQSDYIVAKGSMLAQPSKYKTLFNILIKFLDDVEPYFFRNGTYKAPSKFKIWTWWGLIPLVVKLVKDIVNTFK